MIIAATITKGLRIAVAMLNATMLLNPIPLIIGLVIALITAFGYLMATNEDFRQVVKKVFNFVLKVIIYVFASIVSAIGMWIQGIAFLIRVFGFFVEAVVKVFEFVLDIILTVISSVLKGFRFLIDGFVSLMESQGIFYDVVKFVFNAVIKIITLVISGIINIFARLVGGVADLLGVFNFLFKGVRSIFLSILDAISGVGNGIFKILENVASGIGKFLGQVFDAVTGWVRNLLSIFSKIPGIGPLVANALNAGLDATKKAITGIASLGVDLGKSVFNGVVNGVKATVNGISNIGTSTENTLRKVETTLSKFSAKVVEFGKEDNGAKMISLLVKGAKGASSGLTTVLDAIQKVIDAPLSNTVGDFIDGIAGKVDKAGEMVMGLAATMMEFADKTDFADIVGDKIGGFIDKIKDSLKEGLGFGDILAEEKKKYTDATKKDDGTQAAEDAETMANRLKTIREAMQAGIESIKGVLDDLQQAAQDFAESLKDTIVGFAGLKGVELPDGFIPKAKSLIDNMSKRLDKSKEFAGQIYKLQNMGLDADALKAIIEEGPIKGAQLAASILGGGQSAIDEISRLQKEIQFTGAVIGEYGARVGFDEKIATASTQLRDLQNASLNTSSSGNNTFIEQGAFQVYVDTAGATNEEERASIITKRIEETFATLARQLASK
jgi:phage-related protein